MTLLKSETEEEVVYRIVGDDEADIKQKHDFRELPIARALIGKEVDDVAIVKTPGGDVSTDPGSCLSLIERRGKRQGAGLLLSLVTLIGLDEGVLVALEESVPQLFLILLAQPGTDGPVMAMWLASTCLTRVPVMAKEGDPRCEGIRQVGSPLAKASRQAGHDETSKGEAVYLVLRVFGAKHGLFVESPGAQMGRTQLGNGRRGDAQLGVAPPLPGCSGAGNAIGSRRCGLRVSGAWLAATGFERGRAGCRAGIGWWQCLHRFQVPQHGQFFIGEELMLVHSGCPRLFIAG